MFEGAAGTGLRQRLAGNPATVTYALGKVAYLVHQRQRPTQAPTSAPMLSQTHASRSSPTQAPTPAPTSDARAYTSADVIADAGFVTAPDAGAYFSADVRCRLHCGDTYLKRTLKQTNAASTEAPSLTINVPATLGSIQAKLPLHVSGRTTASILDTGVGALERLGVTVMLSRLDSSLTVRHLRLVCVDREAFKTWSQYDREAVATPPPHDRKCSRPCSSMTVKHS